MFNYRKEIDGLRAIAVISVLLFHAGFSSFSGGYVGVDIFFVISGYLITSFILKEKSGGSFSLLTFYERRIRRIIPALFFVTLLSVPFAFITMSPMLLKEFGNSVISIPLFISNILFWSEAGYFATAGEEKPLLHTWSLAVEEQYYLIFPLFIVFFWRFGKQFLIIVISIVALLSILLAQFGGNINFHNGIDLNPEFRWTAVPEYAFFLTPTRAWEILLGSLTAFYLIQNKKVNRVSYLDQFFSILGLCLILYSIFLFSVSTPFPSIYTLIPTSGTALLILFSKRGTLTYKILSLKYLVGMGLISYSVYLWHQPVLVYSRFFSVNALSNSNTIFLIIFSIFMGYLSWRFIEAPFRNSKKISRKYIFTLTFTFSILLILIGTIINLNDGFEKRFSKSELEIIEPNRSEMSQCEYKTPIVNYPKISFCNIGSDITSNGTIAFIGDSHLDSLVDSLDEKLKNEKLNGFKIDNKYCEPMVFVYRNSSLSYEQRQKCTESHYALINHLNSINVEDVFILYRWTFRLYPIPNNISSLTYDNGEGGKEYVKHYRKYYAFDGEKFSISFDSKKNAVKKLITSFNNSNIKTHLIYPVPESGWNMSKFNMVQLLKGGDIPELLSTSYKKYLERNKFILNLLNEIEEGNLISKIMTENVFCKKILPDRCLVQFNYKPLYYDADHLSNFGAKLLVEEIINHYKSQ